MPNRAKSYLTGSGVVLPEPGSEFEDRLPVRLFLSSSPSRRAHPVVHIQGHQQLPGRMRFYVP